jgi:hypothetical protein
MLQILRSRPHRRRAAMQQLSFLDPPPDKAAPVWNTLDEAQRATIVAKLARLMANTIAHATGEHDDERTDQDHE